MGGGLKSLAKDTFVYGLSSIIGRFLNWLLVPMYVRVLPSPGDYGIVTNLYGWTALLLAFLTFGMETTFAEILREFLTLKGLTQTAFARAVGVKQSQVSEWLRGKASPGYEALRRMSLAYGVSADYFLGLREDF